MQSLIAAMQARIGRLFLLWRYNVCVKTNQGGHAKMTFGEKLQKLRKEKGWTQEQLAAQISISRQALSKWELGSATPDTENVVQISKLFQVSTDYLLFDEYDSDEDLPAVHASNQKVSNSYNNTIRIIIGSCIIGVALLAMLILGILSSVYPARYIEAPVGVEWIRVYDGLFGFLKVHNLEWLFVLLVLALMAGVVTVVYPKLQPFLKKFRKEKSEQLDN